MRSLLKSLRRRRHRKGFGIHSPFAFTLIADVVGYPGHYYGDDLLRDQIGNRRGTLPRRAWLLHRIVARLDPSAVVFPAQTPQELVRAVRIARTDREPLTTFPEEEQSDLMVVADTDYLFAHSSVLSRILTTPGYILMAMGDEDSIERLSLRASVDMPGGWALVDRTTALFIVSASCPFIKYDVKLV